MNMAVPSQGGSFEIAECGFKKKSQKIRNPQSKIPNNWADPAFKAKPCPRATGKGISKVETGEVPFTFHRLFAYNRVHRCPAPQRRGKDPEEILARKVQLTRRNRFEK
jgi:hypothetical protein